MLAIEALNRLTDAARAFRRADFADLAQVTIAPETVAALLGGFLAVAAPRFANTGDNLLDSLKRRAAEYAVNARESLQRNRHMHRSAGEVLDQDGIDAVLVDFINWNGMRWGVDFALYAADLLEAA